MDSQLRVSQDIKLRFLEKDAKYYLNRSTILFGASNSGKSTILIEILYLLRNYVPNIFVFAPTADSNNAFEGIIPSQLIYKTVDTKLLTSIYNRQKASAKIYNTVNNLNDLKNLFLKVADRSALELARIASIRAATIIQNKENDPSNFAQKRMTINQIKKIRDKYLSRLYKKTIRKNKKRLLKIDDSAKTKYIIKYLDFNPNCVVVFDDCGAVLKRFQKEEVVKKIIFQGRHSYINIILTLQDDLNLNSAIKKNAFVNIFTTGRCASAYFERGSNNFSKKDKQIAAKIISYIFDSGKKDYKKLVYLRDEANPFRYTIADLYDNFRFGSPSLWKLCNKLNRDRNNCDFDNDPLLSEFKIDI